MRRTRTFFKKNIAMARVGSNSMISNHARKYRDANPSDREFEHITFPADWLDETGSIKDSLQTANDVAMRQGFNQVTKDHQLDDTQRIIFKERIPRVFTIAMLLTMRMEMLKIECSDDTIEWDMSIATVCLFAAQRYVQLICRCELVHDAHGHS